jgi:hypothetical protein
MIHCDVMQKILHKYSVLQQCTIIIYKKIIISRLAFPMIFQKPTESDLKKPINMQGIQIRLKEEYHMPLYVLFQTSGLIPQKSSTFP